MLALVNYFKAANPVTNRVFLTGASEGGLVTALAVERYPGVFSAGLSTCGPVGDFQAQVNYWSDFRVVFDYYYPKLLLEPYGPGEPSTAIYIPNSTLESWVLGDLASRVAAAVLENPNKTEDLLAVTGAPIDPLDPVNTTVRTVLGILDYNVKSTNEGRMELHGYFNPVPLDLAGSNGGSPFSNVGRVYAGSHNDKALNKKVLRYEADPAAQAAVNAYQTTGALQRPLVVMHTTGDEIVPFWHAGLYAQKVAAQGRTPLLYVVTIPRYGHCAFTQAEAAFGFITMITMATMQAPTMLLPDLVLPDAASVAAFEALKAK